MKKGTPGSGASETVDPGGGQAYVARNSRASVSCWILGGLDPRVQNLWAAPPPWVIFVSMGFWARLGWSRGELDRTVETGGRERALICGNPSCALLVRIRYRACSSPPRVRRALGPTNGKAATDEIREIRR